MTEQLLDALEGVNKNALRIVEGIGDDQWGLPTPCTEWNVRQLVNHMAFSARLLTVSARREAPTFAPDDDHLGDDPAGTFAGLVGDNSASWRQLGAVDGDVAVPAEMPAVAALSANVLDIGIHSWDLATATGRDHGLTAEQIAVIDGCDRMLVTDEVRAGGGFGDALEPADGAALTQMLAFVGRRA